MCIRAALIIVVAYITSSFDCISCAFLIVMHRIHTYRIGARRPLVEFVVVKKENLPEQQPEEDEQDLE
jgi:hypothetical protein